MVIPQNEDAENFTLSRSSATASDLTSFVWWYVRSTTLSFVVDGAAPTLTYIQRAQMCTVGSKVMKSLDTAAAVLLA